MNRSLIGFVISSAVLIFAYGVAVGVYHIFPYKLIKYELNSMETVLDNRKSLLTDEPVNFIAPRTRPGEGVVVNTAPVPDGEVTLLSGFFNDLPGLMLISRNGDIVARWTASYTSLILDSSHIQPATDIPASDWNATVHGMELLADGSVVFNFDGKATVKLDRCGKPVWKVLKMNHHSVNLREDGGFWIPSRHYESESSPYPLFNTPFRNDAVLQISPDGQVVRELMINQILIDNGLFALLSANGRFASDIVVDDVLHLNDAEELSTGMAPAFDYFQPGDLLLSFRHLNMLLVLDPETKTVRWYQSGPWQRQHDPDFQADGTITVFNNNSDDTKRGSILGGSRIVRTDPSDPLNLAKTVYGDKPDQKFYTNTQGKHQRLANGHWLIVEHYAGRVFEIDQAGTIVWEFINGYDTDRVARISGAKRYAAGYLKNIDWSCQ